MRTLGQFLSVLFLVGVVVHYFWWLSGVVVVFGLVWWVERWWRLQEARREARRVADAETAARADQQHAWASAGDPRGTFGDGMSETEWPARGCELYGHTWHGKRPCGSCGAEYVELNEIERRIANAVKYDLYDEAGRDEHAEQVGRKIAKALGLTQEWSDDVAGPDWQRYSRWVTDTTKHPGPSRIAAGLT